MSDIKFKATVDSKKGEVSLKNLDKRVEKVGKTTTRTAAGFKNLAAKVALGVAGFYAAAKALRGMVRWMGDAIDKAAQQETSEKEMAAALESTGREVDKNAKHFKEYASELQQATTFGDEQILSAQALMIQLTKLDREGIDAATKGAIGLAAVYKQDLQAATTLVGKALAGNFGALSRYGISVEKTATAEEKRVSLLEQLGVMYKRAEADTETYAGKVKQLGNVYGDLKEFVAAAVIENEAILDIITKVKESMSDFIEKAKMGQQIKSYKALQEAVGGWTSFAETAAKLTVRQTKDWGSYQTVLANLNTLWEEHGNVTHDTIIALAEGAEGFEDLQEWVWRTYGRYLKAVEAAKPLEKIIGETTEQIDTQLIAIQGVTLGYDNWGRKVVSIDELYKNLQDTLDSMDWPSALPDARDMTGVLEQALPTLKQGTEDVGKLFKGMSKEQMKGMEATWMAAKQIGSALGIKNKEVAYAMAIINTAEAVTKALASAPPPFNLALAAVSAAAGAIQIALISKQNIPSAARGAYLPSPTILEAGHGAHGELVLKPEQLPQVVKEIIKEPLAGAGGMNITIVVQDQLDPYVAQRITRDQIIPQILEALDVNQNKIKFRDRLGI